MSEAVIHVMSLDGESSGALDTDAEGRFAWGTAEDVRARRAYPVEAMSTGNCDLIEPRTAVVVAGGPALVLRRIRRLPVAGVTLSVSDAATGEPVEDARLWTRASWGVDFEERDATDARGLALVEVRMLDHVTGNGGCVTNPQLDFTDTVQITIA